MRYYHLDHLGTPQALSDANGLVVWRGEYRPFGAVVETVADAEQKVRLPGQYEEEEAGGYYNYQRWYDPSTGRYLRSDPIGLDGGINTYLYANANPVRYVDPTGEFAFLLAIPAALGGGGTATAGGVTLAGVGKALLGGTALAALLSLPSDSVTEDTDEACPDKEKNCSKASKYQLRRAGIPGPEYKNEHDFKDAWQATSNRFYDICACSDGSIVIRAQGQCGRSGPTIPTDERWK